ncbi:MAG: hypothetical protein HYS06_11390 [Methylocystis sp.]|nr:hypothetical protein [Methylocystis sp.]
MLAAILIDHAHRRHPGGDEFGDLGVVAGLFFRDQGLGLVVLLQRWTGRIGVQGLTIGGDRVEHIMLAADGDAWLAPGDVKMVGAFLQLLPEGDIGIKPMFGEIFRRHLEGEGLHLNGALTAGERRAGDRVHFGDLLVGHRKTAGRRAGAVHHDGAAAASPSAIISVGIADVEREIIGRVRVHLVGTDGIKPLRHLSIALARLGTKLPGPAAHRIGFQMNIAAIRTHLPDFEFGFLLEGPNQRRCVLGGADLLHQGQSLGRDRPQGPLRERARVLASGQGRERASERAPSDGKAEISTKTHACSAIPSLRTGEQTNNHIRRFASVIVTQK